MKQNILLTVVMVLALLALPASAVVVLSDGFDGSAGSAPDPSKWLVNTWNNNGGATIVEQDGASNVVITTGEPPVTIAGIKATDTYAVATDPGAGLFHRATFEGYSSPGA